MVPETRVEVVDGAPVVVTRGDGAPLRAEAERLRRAAHPGVVVVVSSEPAEDSAWELRTSWSGRPLSIAERVDAAAVARVVAGAAATLADLHELGLVHGHLRAEHVGVGPTGRACLGGFGADDGGASPADDVAALGAMLTELLAGPVEVEAIPERRFARRSDRRRGTQAVLRRSLLTLADQASDEIPTRRPTARRLAADVAALVDDCPAPPLPAGVAPPPPRSTASARIAAALADEQTPSEPNIDEEVDAAATRRPSAQNPKSRPWPRLALLAGGLVVSIALVAATRDNKPSSGGRAAEAPAPAAPATSETSAPPRPASSPAAPPHTVVAGGSCIGAGGNVDVDGDGCPEEVQISRSVVTVGDRRWSVGAEGDVIELGDWDCDGTATPAVLRPSSGEVFVFPSWSTDEVVVGAVDRIPGARDLAGRPSGPGGCTELTVTLPDGAHVVVHTEMAPTC